MADNTGNEEDAESNEKNPGCNGRERSGRRAVCMERDE
jgi:hypothetical protein